MPGHGGFDYDSGGTGSSSSSYTDEEAQDAVGTILVSSTTIAFTYTDATPEITAAVNDAELLALAGVNSTVSTFPYFTGTGTADVAALTPVAWLDWVPNLSGGWALGNSTYVARYARVGRMIHWYAVLTVGTTATKGTGITMRLPVPAANGDAAAVSSQVNFHDVGASIYVGRAFSSTTNSIDIYVFRTDATHATLANPTSAVPFAWTTSDRVIVAGTYEAAT